VPQNVDQSHATAGGDNVAGNKTTIALPPRERIAAFDALKKRLCEDLAADKRVKDTIEKLRRYEKPVSPDGIAGLEDKLNHAGRQDELFYALEQKERFAMFMAEWSFFETAQKLIALALATIEYEYAVHILPNVTSLDRQQVDCLIHDRVVVPLFNDIGVDVLDLDQNLIMGMVYWLGDQCYVRWHQ
jgi:hypothetical protein